MTSSSNGQLGAFIGTDVGGTHTDVAVVYADRVVRGKALTTYDDFSRGLLAAIGVAAEELEMTLAELLQRTDTLINGTTVVTNSITELRGSRVGALMTAGFTDTLRIAGGSRKEDVDDQANEVVPDIVPREAIAAIDERIDWSGSVVVPIDLGQVRDSVVDLVEGQGAEALAICFLSSFINPAHEVAAEGLVRELYPDVFVTASHRVFPIRGETRRFTTAVLNSFVQRNARVYLESLDAALRDAGLRQGVTFFQGLGGAISLERAIEYPLSLLGSGPAAGAIGANELAKAMGHRNVLVGDMGGTSFDTGIIVDNDIRIDKNLQLGPFQTGVNLVDVASVGAGGGSIAWVSDRGVPQVGPHSAGSTPGPACYARGGTQPTVTDALVALGFVDPDRYLGGRVQLDATLATEALRSVLAERFGWSVEDAAASVYELVVVNMATAVREVSVQKGHDPREFLFLAYGGTLGVFASDTADHLGVSTVVIPRNSPVFCAQGLLAADYKLRLDQGVGWSMDDVSDLARVNEIAERTVAAARASIAAEGFAEDEITLVRTADCRFDGQAYELSMPVPDRPLVAADGEAMATAFHDLYEGTYGEGTAWDGVATTMVNFSVTAIGTRPRPQIFRAHAEAAGTAEPRPVRSRDVYLPVVRERRSVPVYDDEAIAVGSAVDGPAIIDAHDTTIYVPPGVTARRDQFFNYVLERESSEHSGV